ncbi:hypothetical protein B484DRAFT_439372 [Ochromonadaceae sp. CCMP2298]|nr:hypothetical protein B484DRAFT_439372 [Ochromonadaceae sp. CCMP2298]
MEERAVDAGASSSTQDDGTLFNLPVPVPGSVVLAPQCIQAPPRLAPLPALLAYNGMLVRQASIPGEPGTPQAEVTAHHFDAESPELPNGDNQGSDLIDVNIAELDPNFHMHRHELVTHFAGRWAQNTIHWPKSLPNPVQAARNASHAQAQVQDAAADEAHAAAAQVHFEDVAPAPLAAMQGTSVDTFVTPNPRNPRFHARFQLEIDRVAVREAAEALEALEALEAQEALEALNSSQDTYIHE